MFGDVAFAQTPFAALGGGGQQYDVSVSEAVAVVEAESTRMDWVAARAESVSLTDVINTAGNIYVSSVSEQVAVTDAQTLQLIRNADMEEAVIPQDQYSATKIVNANPAGIQLYVSIGNVLIWTTINDDQTPSWQQINNTQSGTWTEITNTQTPGWTNIPN